jgi:hypothetical protein
MYKNNQYTYAPIVMNQRYVNYKTPLKYPAQYGQYTVSGTISDDSGDHSYFHSNQPFIGCSHSVDCGKDSKCEGGMCSQTCSHATDCPVGMGCVGGKCAIEKCTNDNQCSSKMCDDKSKHCLVEQCNIDTPCPIGSYCMSTPNGQMCSHVSTFLDHRYAGMY